MFSKITGFVSSLTDGTFVRFKNREKAAVTLYSIIKEHLKNTNKKKVLVLGIPRGGIIMVHTIAHRVGCKFDFIIPSRLVAPHNQELTIGAIMNDHKTAHLNSILIETLKIEKDYLNQERENKIVEINERIKKYLELEDQEIAINDTANDTANGVSDLIINNQYLFKYKDNCQMIILVDEGIYSGASMIVAVRWIIENLRPSKIIVGATVTPKEIISLIKNETNKDVVIVEAIMTPPISKFKTVGRSYQDFMPVDDQKVIEILRSRKQVDVQGLT